MSTVNTVDVVKMTLTEVRPSNGRTILDRPAAVLRALHLGYRVRPADDDRVVYTRRANVVVSTDGHETGLSPIVARFEAWQQALAAAVAAGHSVKWWMDTAYFYVAY